MATQAERDSWQETKKNASEVIVVDDEEENEIASIFIGGTDMKIVGIQYYQGEIHIGELAKLIREPRNPYDSNAIRVDNLNNVQIGHIKKQMAAALVRVMDDRSKPDVQVFCEILRRNTYDCDCRVTIWGHPASSDSVGTILQKAGVNVRGGAYTVSYSALSSSSAPPPPPKPSVQMKQIVARLNSQEGNHDFPACSIPSPPLTLLPSLPPSLASSLPPTLILHSFPIHTILDLDALFDKLSSDVLKGLDFDAARQAIFGSTGIGGTPKVTCDLYEHQLQVNS